MLPIMRYLLSKGGLPKRELTAWYDFQQGADADVLYDISGNGNHGQLGSAVGADVNDPTWTAQGLSFNGSHYVILPFAAPPPRCTLIAVVKVTNTDAHRGIIGTNRSTSYLNIRNSGGEEVVATAYDGGQKVATKKGIATGTVCMVTNRIESGVGVAAFYNKESGVTTAMGSSSSYPTKIGATAGNTIFMVGDIYTVLYYRAALTSREIRQVHAFLKSRLAARGVIL